MLESQSSGLGPGRWSAEPCLPGAESSAARTGLPAAPLPWAVFGVQRTRPGLRGVALRGHRPVESVFCTRQGPLDTSSLPGTRGAFYGHHEAALTRYGERCRCATSGLSCSQPLGTKVEGGFGGLAHSFLAPSGEGLLHCQVLGAVWSRAVLSATACGSVVRPRCSWWASSLPCVPSA